MDHLAHADPRGRVPRPRSGAGRINRRGQSEAGSDRSGLPSQLRRRQAAVVSQSSSVTESSTERECGGLPLPANRSNVLHSLLVTSPTTTLPPPDPRTLTPARNVLREVFGYSEFRPGQPEVIAAVLAGRDTLAVMPTGGG